MLNTQILTQIAHRQGLDPVAIRQSAESIAVPQDHKCWGLTDAQSDVIAVMYAREDLQAVINLAIDHYRTVNGG